MASEKWSKPILILIFAFLKLIKTYKRLKSGRLLHRKPISE